MIDQAIHVDTSLAHVLFELLDGVHADSLSNRPRAAAPVFQNSARKATTPRWRRLQRKDSYFINPILRGWVRYFAVGDASRCFGFVKDWVEKKVRRHLMRARGLRGFGWDRWSRRWLYEHLGLFEGYRVCRPPKALPTG